MHDVNVEPKTYGGQEESDSRDSKRARTLLKVIKVRSQNLLKMQFVSYRVEHLTSYDIP